MSFILKSFFSNKKTKLVPEISAVDRKLLLIEETPALPIPDIPNRTKVWVRTHPDQEFQKATFTKCFFDYFNIDNINFEVEFFLHNNQIYLQPYLPLGKSLDIYRLSGKSKPCLLEVISINFTISYSYSFYYTCLTSIFACLN